MYVCQSCQFESVKWYGQCSQCHEWNSFIDKKAFLQTQLNSSSPVVPVAELKGKVLEVIDTGCSEFNHVLGGGLVKGSLLLLTGTPGAGKSTLLITISNKIADTFKTLYISGEETVEQVGMRARNLQLRSKNLYITHECVWESMIEKIKQVQPEFVVIDSIQTTRSKEIVAGAGSTKQVKELTLQIMNFMKERKMTCVIVGHITKGGDVAGPKQLEHMVDTVLSFKGHSEQNYRILEASKNRFGPVGEAGFFTFRDQALVPLDKLDSHFISKFDQGFGMYCLQIKGRRSFPVELQSLLIKNTHVPKMITSGLNKERLNILVGILQKFLGIKVHSVEMYLSTLRGLSIEEKESDLAIIATMYQAFTQRPLTRNFLLLGEVGLSGHIYPDKREIDPSFLQKDDLMVVVDKEKSLGYTKARKNVIGISHVRELPDILFSCAHDTLI